MSGRLRMVHLRTVPDAWHAKVLAARLGCEGIVTQLRGNVSWPYPFGAVSVLVEEEQAQLAADLLLADEVEAAFTFNWPGPEDAPVGGSGSDNPFGGPSSSADLSGGASSAAALSDLLGGLATTGELTGCDEVSPRVGRSNWRRVLAAAAAIVVAGAPLLAHFVS